MAKQHPNPTHTPIQYISAYCEGPAQGLKHLSCVGRHMADEATAVAAFKEYIAASELGRWPTIRELYSARRHDLRYAVQLHGAAALAQRLGLQPPRRGRRRSVSRLEQTA